MDLDQTLMVAGIGCRSGVSAEQVEAAIEAALGAAASRTLTAIATPAAKGHEPGIIAAAASRGIPLMLISQSALEAANSATLTRSEHSMAAMNVHSVAEASAVAAAAELADTTAIASGDNARAAGAGVACSAGGSPKPRLLGPRIAVGPVTCALADTAATALTPTSADAHTAALAANATAPTPANTAPWAPADAAPPVLTNPTPTTP